MRYALIGTAVLVAFASATYACGSDPDDPTPVAPKPDAGKTSTSSSSSSSSGSTSSSSGNTSSSSSSGNSASSTSSGSPPVIADSGTVVDAASTIPTGPTLDASDPDAFDGAAGTQCLAGSIQEVEVNNTAATANTIPGKTGSFCGHTAVGDPDFVQFTLPVDAAEMSIGVQNAGAAFQLDGTVDGTSFQLAGADAGSSFPFKPGSTYVFQASTTGASSDYILGLSIKQVTSSLCNADSVKETEANDTEATANTFTLSGKTPSFCGTINTTTDVDTLTFTLPSATTGFELAFKTTGGGPGSFKISGSADGKTFEIPKPAGGADIPFVKDKPYVLKLTSTAPNNSYVVNLTLKP